jgi:hypothetical protein
VRLRILLNDGAFEGATAKKSCGKREEGELEAHDLRGRWVRRITGNPLVASLALRRQQFVCIYANDASLGENVAG